MATTPLGDIPGARFFSPQVFPHASVATNGANAKLGYAGPFAFNIRVTSAWWTPTGAGGNTAAATASYRRLSLVNGGAAGSGTAIIASLNLSASYASLAPQALTVDTTQTLSAGHNIYASQATVGGTNDDGTILPAGQFALSYEII